MNLHILNQSPNKSSAQQDMLSAVSAGDAILLIEDGVISATSALSAPLADAQTPVYVLEADVLARGLAGRINKDFVIVSDDGFVQLCCQYAKTVSWF